MFHTMKAAYLVMFAVSLSLACVESETTDPEAPSTLGVDSACSGPKCDAFDPGDRVETPDVVHDTEVARLSGEPARIVEAVLMQAARDTVLVEMELVEDHGGVASAYSPVENREALRCITGAETLCELQADEVYVLQGRNPADTNVTLFGGEDSGVQQLADLLAELQRMDDGYSTPIVCSEMTVGAECTFHYVREVPEVVEAEHTVHFFAGTMEVAGEEPPAIFIELMREFAAFDEEGFTSERSFESDGGHTLHEVTAPGVECAWADTRTQPTCTIHGVEGSVSQGWEEGTLDVVFDGPEGSGAHAVFVMTQRLESEGIVLDIRCSSGAGAYVCGFTY